MERFRFEQYRRLDTALYMNLPFYIRNLYCIWFLILREFVLMITFDVGVI